MALELSRRTEKSNLFMVYFEIRLKFDLCHLVVEMAQLKSFDGQIQYMIKSQSTHIDQGSLKRGRNYTFAWATLEVLSCIKLESMMIETHPLLLGLNSEFPH